MSHTVCDFTHLWSQFVLSLSPIFVVTFALWGDLYEVCSNFKHREGKKPGNREKIKCSEI